jgi:putative FmdB family regulatory protein
MPIYEYVCEDCGATTESLRKMADADTAVACERCGSARTRRVQSSFAVGGSAGQGASLPVASGCACGRSHGPCGSHGH